MTTKTKPIPKGHHSVTPYLSVKGAANAIEFYKRAFGAKEVMRIAQSNGQIGHAEIQVGDSRIMLADEFPDMNFRGPQSFGGSPVHIHLYVEDSDKVFSQAVTAGAKVLRPVQDQFYGDRSGSLEDPFGHVWHISTHKQDLTPKEIQMRAASAHQGGDKK